MSKVVKEKKKKDRVVVLLDFVIVILVFVMLGAALNLSFYLNIDKDAYSFSQDATMLSYELQNKDYASIIQGKYVNKMRGNNIAKSYHAFADYVEAASKYKIYEAKGYETRATNQKEIMHTSREQMGDLIVFADKVDRMLE